MNFFGKLLNKFMDITSKNKKKDKIENTKKMLVEKVLTKKKSLEKVDEIQEIDLKPPSEPKKTTRKPRKKVTKDDTQN